MIEFKRGFRHGRGIILDAPVRGVIIGIIECAQPGCEWRCALTEEDGHGDPKKLAGSVDRFLKLHDCGKEPAS